MFKRIRLTNYRTHKDTTIELGGLTLLIGNNNSGKTNFISGIRHFSQLMSRARPSAPLADEEIESEGTNDIDLKVLRKSDFYPHLYRRAQGQPMALECDWSHALGEVQYHIELHEDPFFPSNVGCREVIKAKHKKSDSFEELTNGFETPTDRLELREIVQKTNELSDGARRLSIQFFRDMSQAFAYHLQPAFLKGQAKTNKPVVDPQRISVPSQLGYEGSNLQSLLYHLSDTDERSYQRFIAGLRRFERSFHGIRRDTRNPGRVLWEFDLGEGVPGRLDEFTPETVSDGLMKAAAVSLLTAFHRKPALMLMEEIENGVNPGNIQEFLHWLWQAAGSSDSSERGYNTQFIITSHSPSVLREFHENLNNVYTVRLDRHGFRSDVRNLLSALDYLVGVGTVEGEIREEEGMHRVVLPKYRLAELWYEGTIG